MSNGVWMLVLWMCMLEDLTYLRLDLPKLGSHVTSPCPKFHHWVPNFFAKMAYFLQVWVWQLAICLNLQLIWWLEFWFLF